MFLDRELAAGSPKLYARAVAFQGALGEPSPRDLRDLRAWLLPRYRRLMSFPSEPVRTFDAIHLASALAVRSTVPSVEPLSLDDRIRRAGEQLGFRLQPR
jgi:hypothetical protein